MKDLVARLRYDAEQIRTTHAGPAEMEVVQKDCAEAADALEAQAREIEAMKAVVEEARNVLHKADMDSALWRLSEALTALDAAQKQDTENKND